MSKSFILGSVLTLFLLQTGIAAYASPDQLNDDDTTMSSVCTNIPVRIQYGSKDTATTNHVMMLQDFLYENNYLTLQPTGFFGAGTYRAVKAFQKANGIAQTGSLGPATRAKIKTISCLGSTVQGNAQTTTTTTVGPSSTTQPACSGVRPTAGVNGVASVRDYSGNTWGGGDTTKPSTVWHFGADSSCSYQCATGMVQDDKGGCRKNVVALTQTTQANYVVVTCSGTRPTAGIGGVTAGIGYSSTSVGGGGAYQARTDWHYGTDSCSWSCDFPMTHDGGMGCKSRPAGTGVRVKVVDITGKGMPNISITSGTLISVWGGEHNKAVTTNANGDAPEFWYAYASSVESNFINVDAPGYKIKSAKGCKHSVSVSYGKQLNQCWGAYNSETNSVEITLAPGDAASAPVTTINYDAIHNTLSGEITKGDADNMWSCIESPNTVIKLGTLEDYRCKDGPRSDVYRKLGGAGDLWQIVTNTDGSKKVVLTNMSTAGYPSGKYALYSRNNYGVVGVPALFTIPEPSSTTGVSSAPSTRLNYNGINNTLTGEITGGDPNNTWGCMDNPNTKSGYECLGANGAWRKLGGAGDSWQIVGGTKIVLTPMSTLGFPPGNYTAYSRGGDASGVNPTGLIGSSDTFTLPIKAASGIQSSPLSYVAGNGKVLGDYVSNASCVDLSTNLFRGKEGESVTKLQNFLEMKGLLIEEDRGFYGDNTISAVKDYQMSKDLPATGMVYETTRLAIKLDSCK